MRIGAFAKHNHTSIDTIRHYMALELIVPEKDGAQYLFDATCQSDFDEICQLKSIGFTLVEIQTLLLFRRIGKLTGYDKRITYNSYFENKLKTVTQELQRLDHIKIEIEKALENSAKIDAETGPTLGVPMDSLKYIYCNHCESQYQLLEGKIEQGDLMSGTLKCSCGKSLTISGGILYGEGIKVFDEHDQINHPDEHYIDTYIQTTDSDYLRKLYKELEWSKHHAGFSNFENGVILELGSGHGFFMRHFIGSCHSSNLYIAVDFNPTAHRWLKKVIERSQPKCKILFLCADFERLPLKKDSVDLLLDISGSSNYAFEHANQFLLDIIRPYTKANSILHAYYILFENFSKHTNIHDSVKKWFKRDIILDALMTLDYQKLDAFESKTVEKGGPMESYFVQGERVYTYLYYGKRRQ